MVTPASSKNFRLVARSRSAMNPPMIASSSRPFLHALDVGREPRILDQLGPADLDQHALGHALGRGRQADPVAVLGLVDVARRGIGRAAAGAHLHLAGQLVVGGLRAQHREQRIEQRQVHHLALAAVHLDLAQRHHHRAVAVERGHGVGEIHRRQHRLAVAEAVHRGEAAIAFDQGAEARLVAIAAVLAPARDAHDDQLGIDLVQLGRRQPHVLEHARAGSSRPGSARVLASSRTMVRPASERRSSATLFLLRL